MDGGGSVPSVETDGTATPASELTCFVIGPIGNRLADHGSDERLAYEEALATYEELIRPACQAVGLEPVRADGLARAGELTEQIFRRLREDSVVVADLTGANANVMYELGLRHTRNLLTLQVGEFSRLPFDINVIRTVMFSRSTHGYITARKELEQLLRAGLAGQWDPVTATRVWNPEEPGSSTEPPSLVEPECPNDEASDEDEPGLVDLLVAAEDAQETFVSASTGIGSAIERMGLIAEQASEAMNAADTQGLGMRAKLAATVKFAGALDKIAQDLESYVSKYAEAMSAISGGYSAIILQLEGEPERLEDQETLGFALTARAISRQARESLASLAGLVDSLANNAKLARALRPPTRRITAAFDNFATATQKFDEWDRRLQALGVPVPEEDSGPDSLLN